MRTKYLIKATHNVHPHHPETLLDTPTSPCVHVLCQRSLNGLIILLLNNFTSSVHTALSNTAFRFLRFSSTLFLRFTYIIAAHSYNVHIFNLHFTLYYIASVFFNFLLTGICTVNIYIPILAIIN